MKTLGPMTVHGGAKSPSGATFQVSTHGVDLTVELTVDARRLAALVTSMAAEDHGAALVPMTFRPTRDGGFHAPFTLPRPSPEGWVAAESTPLEVQLAAGGNLTTWLTQIGAGVSECEGAACIHFPANLQAAPLLACIVTRVLPVLTGYDLAAPPPWFVPPSKGKVKGTGKTTSGPSADTVVGRLELYPKLVDAVAEAVSVAGPRVEYGIVEHHFAYANVDDYRELHRMFGHLSVDHPMTWSMSGYLAGRLGQLANDDDLVHELAKGTGYWSYNSDISSWSLPGASNTPVTSWASFAREHLAGHPAEWPAAALLWGTEPMLDRDWTGHKGPGEEGSGLQLADVPSSVEVTGFVDFASSFDAPAAFGSDLQTIHDRVQEHWLADKGLPRDLGMLRACLWVHHRSPSPDTAFMVALLKRMTVMF